MRTIAVAVGCVACAPGTGYGQSASDAGFWVVLANGARVPFNHPLAQGGERPAPAATPSPRLRPAPISRVLTPSDPDFWVTLPNGARLPYNHPDAAGFPGASAPAPAPVPVEPKVPAVRSPSDPGFWVTLPNGARLPYNHPLAIAAAVQQPAPAPEPEPAPAPTSPVPTSSTSTSLKVLDWNIHHGVGTDGVYDIDRIAAAIAKASPDVVSLNEVERYTGWGNEDQPARFRDLLQSATGQPWYYHFAQEYGNWDANGKGNLLLSRYPFVATGRETLSWSRTMGIATIVVNGRNINVMSTHLDPESRDRREEQARQVVSIASSWSHPRIITGDFNAWPDQSSIKVMTAAYVDSWAKAEASGAASSFAGNSPFGATKNGRIDYIFHSPGSTVLFLQRVQVPDTRDSSGIMPSDHRPVISTYEVR